MIELDEHRGAEGCELDEMTAHRFLENFEETLTVREMREVLREIDIVSLIEFVLLDHYRGKHYLKDCKLCVSFYK